MDARTDYEGQGVDQLAEVVEKLRHRPFDRRIVLSAWNPRDLGKMALPPCHMFCQFYVSFPGAGRGVGKGRGDGEGSGGVGGTAMERTENGDVDEQIQSATVTGEGGGDRTAAPKPRGRLSCQLYQRSCDMGLGVPFNIASYALLTHMLAHVCDLDPGEFIHTMGDAHVYLDHVEALKVQLEREPREFPEIELKPERGGSIDGWKIEDVEIKGYKPYPGIAMKMSV